MDKPVIIGIAGGSASGKTAVLLSNLNALLIVPYQKQKDDHN